MNEIIPEAYFDTLAISHAAPASVIPMSVIEMHLFSYLGCILALFSGCPIGDWGYSYAITSEGFPFSAHFEESRRLIVRLGLLEESPDGLLKPERDGLLKELKILELDMFEWRQPLLKAATECALALPVGSIRHAINQSPGIAPSLKLGQRKRLLEDDDIGLLYEEYKIITSVLGPQAHEILSPAVIWLSARILRTEDIVP